MGEDRRVRAGRRVRVWRGRAGKRVRIGSVGDGWGRTGRRAEACADVGMREEWRWLGFEEGHAVEQIDAEEELAYERIMA